MHIGGGTWPLKHAPVHETITLTALIRSKFEIPPDTTYIKAVKEYDADTLEFLRGICWNDDPANLLFNDSPYFSPKDNFSRGVGKDWAVKFAEGKLFNPVDDSDEDKAKYWRPWPANIIARSHFGDLQFLHAMAENPGEEASVTKEKIITWLEVMYNVAIGKISPETKLEDVQLASRPNEFPLRRYFDGDTEPTGSISLRSLLTSDHSFTAPIIPRRALGSCLHTLQDSYARGHCHRHRLPYENPPTRFGPICNFHSFRGQDEGVHSKYDYGDRDMEDADCEDIAIFKDMDGCTDAVLESVKLIDFWCEGRQWEDGVGKWLAEEVFYLADDATPSNTEVV